MSVDKKPVGLRESLADLQPFFKRAAWLSLVTSLLLLAPSAYMLSVYDRVVSSRNPTTLAMLTLLVLGTYVIMEVFNFVRSQVMHEASLSFDRQMSERVFDAMFAARLQHSVGGTSQPMSDLKTVREFLNAPVLTTCMEVPVSVVFLLLIFAINPLLGWLSVATAIIQSLLAWLNQRSSQPLLISASTNSIAATQYAESSLRNAQVIESMGMLDDIHARWKDKQAAFMELQTRASNISSLFQVSSKFLQNITGSLLLGLGAWLALGGNLDGGLGMMIVASILGGRVLAPLVQIVAQWQSVIGVRNAWSRLNRILESIPIRAPNMTLPVPKGSLSVERVVVAAPGSQLPILKGVAFALNPGEVLAVIGPSASGKTTLARALIGMWPSSGGKVRLNGVDVFVWDKNELGPHIGYLPQGIELFDGTLAENISRFGDLDQLMVEAAARAVGIHEEIMALPDGYQSNVGRDGAILSGGQRQRVGLARAIYGNPVFVVLDEPNSNLDDLGDIALANTVAQLKSRGTTLVIITHRQSILGVADKLLVLKDGQTLAFGPRDEVLAALTKSSQNVQSVERPAKAAMASA